jgi:hypothetical protein
MLNLEAFAPVNPVTVSASAVVKIVFSEVPLYVIAVVVAVAEVNVALTVDVVYVTNAD